MKKDAKKEKKNNLKDRSRKNTRPKSFKRYNQFMIEKRFQEKKKAKENCTAKRDIKRDLIRGEIQWEKSGS